MYENFIFFFKMERNDRFMQVFEALKESGKISTYVQLAEILNTNKAGINDIKNNRKKISIDAINSMIKSYPEVNISYILEGNGPIFHTDQFHIINQPKEDYIIKKGIPLVNLHASAGKHLGEIVFHEHEVESRYVIPEFAKADFLIRVKGSSMYPKYSPGDILACIKMNKDNFIQWNKAYVLDTTQGIMVKRILKGSAGTWILRSDNKDYQDIDVNPAQDIYAISLVIGVIRLE